jgi:peptide/nickel transport system permease protein
VGRFIVRRLLEGLAIVALVAALTFALIHLAPGDPFADALADTRLSDAARARMRAAWGLDRPPLTQFAQWMASTARGDLGVSIQHNRPVRDVLRSVLPPTLLLMGTALLVSLVAGMALGVAQAAHAGSRFDRWGTRVSLFLASLPDFWLALFLLLALGYWLPIFPVGGMQDAVMAPYRGTVARAVDVARHLVLPALTLALLAIPTVARFQRAAMLEVMPDDWIRTARAKGLSERAVIYRHALRNAIAPVITLTGLALPALLGGAVFVETVFAWPGMGRTAVGAVAARDYPLVMACTMIGGVLVVIGGLCADLAQRALDPRVDIA